MRAVESAFKRGSGVASMIEAAAGDRKGTKGDLFYALLYSALYYEAEGQAGESKDAMLQAVATPYAQQSDDYMASVAQVHCKQRGWSMTLHQCSVDPALQLSALKCGSLEAPSPTLASYEYGTVASASHIHTAVSRAHSHMCCLVQPRQICTQKYNKRNNCHRGCSATCTATKTPKIHATTTSGLSPLKKFSALVLAPPELAAAPSASCVASEARPVSSAASVSPAALPRRARALARPGI